VEPHMLIKYPPALLTNIRVICKCLTVPNALA